MDETIDGIPIYLAKRIHVKLVAFHCRFCRIAHRHEWGINENIICKKFMASCQFQDKKQEYYLILEPLIDPPENVHKYRPRAIGNGVRFRVLEKYGFKCHYCGVSASVRSLEMDHVIPISRGGHNVFENLVPACRPCNGGKGTRLLSVIG